MTSSEHGAGVYLLSVLRRELVTQESASAIGHDVPAGSVREQLARILGSETFAKAQNLRRFLSYVVEHSLQRDPPGLKEYIVGVEVFDRGERFDPATDTIVRVQARRLRTKLRRYYASEGLGDTISIELPKGQYAAVFRMSEVAYTGVTPFLIHSAPGAGSGLHALPVPCTPLVGRERELAAVTHLLRCEHVRLVTLTGAGGSGKTRLALRAASELSDEFPGGVCFVAMASVTDPDTVASAIAQRLGLRPTGDRLPPEMLREFVNLAIQIPTLLLLDSFEHVLDAAPLLVSLVETSRKLKLLVTSRAVLHVSGEHEYVVRPLPVPDLQSPLSVTELAANPAVNLFMQRAGAADASFALTGENASTIAEICSHLDGLPLAIELAAARARVLSPAAMLSRLGRSLELLTNGSRDLPARQQTLRRTIDWSHTLLSPAEQTLFRRLSVFAGGCTLESAEAVCCGRNDLDGSLLDVIASLVDKSLLYRTGYSGREVRFAMLQTVREYGQECLAKSGELEWIRRAHAAYFRMRRAR